MNGTDATEAQVHAAIGALIHIARLHHRSIDRLSDASGLNRSPCMLLLRMAREGRLPSQRALADAFDISPALVARTLKRLTLQGYISREEDPQDPRRNAIAITPAGRQHTDQAAPVFLHENSFSIIFRIFKYNINRDFILILWSGIVCQPFHQRTGVFVNRTVFKQDLAILRRH